MVSYAGLVTYYVNGSSVGTSTLSVGLTIVNATKLSVGFTNDEGYVTCTPQTIASVEVYVGVLDAAGVANAFLRSTTARVLVPP